MSNFNVSVYGDSLMQGVLFDCKNDKYYLNGGIVTKIAKDLDINIKNYSRFGMTTKKAVGIFDKNIESENCDAMILEYGGNDSNYIWSEISKNPYGEYKPAVSLDLFEQNLEHMIKGALAKNIKVVVATLPPISSEKFFNFVTRKGLSKDNVLLWLGEKEHIYRHHERYNAVIVKLAKKYDLMIADIRDSFLQEKSCKDLLCEDGMHPNISGQNIMYNTFLDFYKHLS